MSELDLFGNVIAEEKKKPAKQQAPIEQSEALKVNIQVDRPCFYDRSTGWLINSDCAHLFR